jgi:phosphoenolpyruvate carboxylase
LAAAAIETRRTLGREALATRLAGFELRPVFTAHPTEARRRAVVTAIARVGEQLDRLDDTRLGEAEHVGARRRLLEEVTILWRTAHLRQNAIDPLDEVRTAMAAFDTTLFRVVPEFFRSLERALVPNGAAGLAAPEFPVFLHFGSWVGGDRDGNPYVTAEVTRAAMDIQEDHALAAFHAATSRIGRSLTADGRTTPASAELVTRWKDAAARWPELAADIELRSPGEPHRQLLLLAAARLSARRDRTHVGYETADEFVADLRIVQESLLAAGAKRLAFGELQNLLWQAETFGFHLAELEVRQHSSVHAQACAELRAGEPLSERTQEVLDTIGVMADLQARLGVDACRRYVVSFTRSPEDVAVVYELAEQSDRAVVLDVVPLFETGDDLAHCTQVLDGVLEVPAVQARLAENGRRMEVMLGYSDSAKDVGPITATLAQYDAQDRLARWAERNDIVLTLFHGRGGALGRGGGPANRAVLSQAPGSVSCRFKVTEQGEVIFARYGNPVIAQRHLEQVAGAVLLASTPQIAEHVQAAAARFRPVADVVSAAAQTAYRTLVEAPGFADFFAAVSPLEEIGDLRIGSRPARRSAAKGVADLRAIPWVFAWSQTRCTVPGWYGLGSGMAAVGDVDLLRDAYRAWPLFTSLVDNAEMSLAKCDRDIAARHFALGDRPDLAQRLLEELDLTTEWVLKVLGVSRLLEGRFILGQALELRNPYVDALSHLQLRALSALRRGVEEADRERTLRLLLLSVNGIAAGLQNTG